MLWFVVLQIFDEGELITTEEDEDENEDEDEEEESFVIHALSIFSSLNNAFVIVRHVS